MKVNKTSERKEITTKVYFMQKDGETAYVFNVDLVTRDLEVWAESQMYDEKTNKVIVRMFQLVEKK